MSTSASGAPSVAVVGGGIAGLVCATDLASHGFQVSVFDMGKVNPGGRLAGPEGALSVFRAGCRPALRGAAFKACAARSPLRCCEGCGSSPRRRPSPPAPPLPRPSLLTARPPLCAAGGRSSTRRTSAMGLQFDHGAQFFAAASPRFQQLVKSWQGAGAVQQWHAGVAHLDAATGAVTAPAGSSSSSSSGGGGSDGSSGAASSSGRGADGGFFGCLSGRPLYVGSPGMGALCAHLAASPQLREARTGVRVSRAAFDKYGKWLLEGVPLAPVVRQSERAEQPLARPWNLGVFDALVLADKMVAIPGTPGALELTNAGPLAPALEQMRGVGGTPLFSLMVAFRAQQRLLPFEAASVSNSAALQWLAHDSAKPGRQRSDGLQCWVAVSTPQFARQLLGEPGPDGRLPPQTPEYLASLAPLLYKEVAALLRRLAPEQELPEPVFVQCQRWGSALPAAPLGRPCLAVPRRMAAACGDFCLGGGVEGAVESALAASEAVQGMLRA
jgi:renalase